MKEGKKDMQSLSAVSETNQSLSGDTTRKIKTELGKDEFMQILVTQLRNQDPLSPMEDRDFIAQMAQFSVVEQIQNLNTGSSFAQACGLVGKQVFATVTASDGSSKAVSGLVKSVQTMQGVPYLQVGDTMIPYSTDLIVYDKSVEIV